MEPVEVMVVPAPSPVRSTPTETRTKMPAKPISEQVFVMCAEGKQDDHTSNSTKVESVTEPHATDVSYFVEVNPSAAVSGIVGHEVEAEVEVEKEVAAAGAQVCHSDNTSCSLLTRSFHQGLAPHEG